VAVSVARITRALSWLLLLLLLALGATARTAQGASSIAEGIYAAAPPRLLQIRTLVADAGQQASIGSGFLVSADGLAITNYHVVSQAVLEPKTYRLEYAAADGSRGELSVVGVDLPNDLAIVRLAKADAPFFTFDSAAMEGAPSKGERLYSMGNPLDLGFTIIEGTYNGLVDRTYNDRVHFSGALNPGMSGGPIGDLTKECVLVSEPDRTERRRHQLVRRVLPPVIGKRLGPLQGLKRNRNNEQRDHDGALAAA
jgi:serine protease Do